MNDLVSLSATSRLPAVVAAAGERAGVRFLEFFAANIRNPRPAAVPPKGRVFRTSGRGTASSPARCWRRR
jgi:hypothetical protein